MNSGVWAWLRRDSGVLLWRPGLETGGEQDCRFGSEAGGVRHAHSQRMGSTWQEILSAQALWEPLLRVKSGEVRAEPRRCAARMCESGWRGAGKYGTLGTLPTDKVGKMSRPSEKVFNVKGGPVWC